MLPPLNTFPFKPKKKKRIFSNKFDMFNMIKGQKLEHTVLGPKYAIRLIRLLSGCE